MWIDFNYNQYIYIDYLHKYHDMFSIVSKIRISMFNFIFYSIKIYQFFI